jgi:hypothetical protein
MKKEKQAVKAKPQAKAIKDTDLKSVSGGLTIKDGVSFKFYKE